VMIEMERLVSIRGYLRGRVDKRSNSKKPRRR
jgi:hypothetical protein